MNNVTTKTPARSLGFLTLACAVCYLPFISAAQDVAPPPAASGTPAPRDLRQADETFLQFEGASVKSAYEKKKAVATRFAAALRKYAAVHENYLPARVEDMRETDPELFQQFDSRELKILAQGLFARYQPGHGQTVHVGRSGCQWFQDAVLDRCPFPHSISPVH